MIVDGRRGRVVHIACDGLAMFIPKPSSEFRQCNLTSEILTWRFEVIGRSVSRNLTGLETHDGIPVRPIPRMIRDVIIPRGHRASWSTRHMWTAAAGEPMTCAGRVVEHVSNVLESPQGAPVGDMPHVPFGPLSETSELVNSCRVGFNPRKMSYRVGYTSRGRTRVV